MRSAVQLLVIVLLIAFPAVVCTGQGSEIRSADGKTLAVEEGNYSVKLRDVSPDSTGPFEVVPSWYHQTARSTHTVSSFSPDGKLLATQRTYGPVILWDVQGRRTLAAFGGSGDDGVSLKFSWDSKLLLSVMNAGARSHHSDRSNGISVWDVGTLKELLHVRESQDTEFNEVVFSPDGKTVMALTGTKCSEFRNREDRCATDTIKLWDIERAKELPAVRGKSAEFSPDGRSLLVNEFGRQTIWDISSGRKEKAVQPATPSRARGFTLTADNVAKSIGDDKWNWTVFLKGDQRDIASISCVEYTLHPSFPNPVRLVCDWQDLGLPFGLSATGWGTFSIGIRVFMKDGTHHDLKHQLKF